MRTVLLVDPSPFRRKLLARALEVHGYHVVQVTSAMAAIAAYADAQPEVIVMSHVLPDLDGVAALKTLQVVDASARVILIGPVSHPATVLEARRAGALDFVAQPLEGDRLFRAIGKLLTPVVA